MAVKPQIEARRGYTGPAVLERGFRPFFFMAGLWALAMVPLWLAALSGLWAPATTIDLAAWHGHELIFGYGGAVVIGFALTAIPNWTGRLPVRGWGLALLAGGWAVARLASLAGLANEGAMQVAIRLDVAVLAAFVGLVWREIVAGRNWRNLPVAGLFTLFLAADVVSVIQRLDLVQALAPGPNGRHAGLACLILLVSLIGGRIVPSFTGNWLRQRGASRLPVPFGRYDAVVLAATALALAAWLAGPGGMAGGVIMAGLALLHVARLARWRGLATLAEPLVTVLHVAYLWIPFGFALIAAAELGLLPASAGLHAWTIGAVGGMTLAVMTRASLGHSGRALTASRLTTTSYSLLHLAALSRVLDGIAGAGGGPFLYAAGALWSGAFALYLLEYAPIQWRRRPD